MGRLYGTDQLLVSLDRAALKPPQRPQSPGWGEAGPLHWDMPKEQLLQPEVLQRLLASCTRIQGVLFLEDTSEAGGGFCCVDGFHRKIEEWVSSDAVNRKAEMFLWAGDLFVQDVEEALCAQGSRTAGGK